MGAVELELYVSYSQIAVCDPGEPLNMWTKTHYDQGFSWRKGSVSFATLSEAVRTRVRVSVASEMTLPEGTVRAIAIPYAVGNGGVEVGSVDQALPIGIPMGMSWYSLPSGQKQRKSTNSSSSQIRSQCQKFLSQILISRLPRHYAWRLNRPYDSFLGSPMSAHGA